MFLSSRKAAQQTAQRLLSGHFTLLAWWALKHAGVFDAMLKMEDEGEGLDPLVHATRANMAPDVLGALIDYLATTGLIAIKDQQARLTTDGKALLEQEDSLLELMRSYEPVLDVVEHLLARLKTATGGGGGGGGGGDGRASENGEHGGRSGREIRRRSLSRHRTASQKISP